MSKISKTQHLEVEVADKTRRKSALEYFDKKNISYAKTLFCKAIGFFEISKMGEYVVKDIVNKIEAKIDNALFPQNQKLR